MDGFARATLMFLRRRLQSSSNAGDDGDSGTNAAVRAANNSSSDDDLDAVAGSDYMYTDEEGSEYADMGSGSEMSEEDLAFTERQLSALRISGTLSIVLYTALAIAILWMTYLHFRHGSGMRKKLFHLVLFTAIILNIPDPVGWILWPETENWVYTYVMRVYSVLLQSGCKSYLALCWAEVVSAGQTDERRRMKALVIVLNSLLVVWAVIVLVIIAPYSNDFLGQVEFMGTALRGVVTYAGVGVVFAYGILLFYQGMRLRRRLLQAKGTVPAGSVEKSLYQLMLTVTVIVTSDLTRVISLMVQDSIDFTPFVVLNGLIPNIFPAICMLYLMRRVPRGKKKKSSGAGSGGVDATLSRYMAEDKRSDVSDATAYAAGSTKFALASTRVSGIARLEYQHDQQYQQPSQLSPPFSWSK